MSKAITITAIEQGAIDELGLRRIDASELTIQRIVRSKGFEFLKGEDRPVGRRDRHRIAELAIPPAWSDVQIANDPNAHLQAVGRDAAGRLQYIYHAAWDDVRAATKAFRLIQLGDRLPQVRRAMARDLATDSSSFPLAVAARLIDLLHLRAGHESYAGPEGGRGAATLLKRHVEVDGSIFRLRFRGKGGKLIDKIYTDPAIALALEELLRLRGPRLFKLKTNDGYRSMTASDLNDYLAQVSGTEVTAKDFRTMYASSAALDRLCQCETPATLRQRRREIAETARLISAELVNTPGIVRKSYIHPLIIEKFEKGELESPTIARSRRHLSRAETRLIALLAAWSGSHA